MKDYLGKKEYFKKDSSVRFLLTYLNESIRGLFIFIPRCWNVAWSSLFRPPWEPAIKGIWSPNEFFKAYKIKSVLSVHPQMVLNFFACFVEEINKHNISACFLENTSQSKDCSNNRIKFLFRLSFSLIGRFFPVDIPGQLSEQLSGTQAVTSIEGNLSSRRMCT